MVLWPAGVALGLVWLVFRDPAFDYRLVVVGAVLPEIVDAPLGGARYLHTLAACVLALAGVMLATRHRRRLRRHLLAVPIGMFLHLVLDGVWTKPGLLWWPLFGTAFPPARLVPPPGLALAEELAGSFALGWFVWRFRLREPQPRREFLHRGRLMVGSS